MGHACSGTNPSGPVAGAYPPDGLDQRTSQNSSLPRGWVNRASRLVRRVPPAVGLSGKYRREAGFPHAPRGDERLGLSDVEPRPGAVRPAGRVTLQVVVLVVRFALAVDPAVA